MLYGNSTIIKSLESNGLQHNLLLLGPKGIGKGTLARRLASDFLQIQSVVHPDLYILDKGSQTIKIEDIRELQTFVSYKPACASKKVFIIDNANNLTIEAQNCLLKVLEDKQQTCLFILVAHDHLLDTILSRVQVIRFQPLSLNEMESYLRSRKTEDISFYLCISNGSVGNYINYADNQELICCLQSVVQHYNSHSDPKDLYQILGLVKEKDNANFYERYTEEYDALLSLLESIYKNLYLYMIKLHIEIPLINYKSMADEYSVTRIISILSLLGTHKKSCKARGYTKQDFFQLIMNIVEI